MLIMLIIVVEIGEIFWSGGNSWDYNEKPFHASLVWENFCCQQITIEA